MNYRPNPLLNRRSLLKLAALAGGSAEFTKSAFKFKDKQIYLAKCTEPLPIQYLNFSDQSTCNLEQESSIWTQGGIQRLVDRADQDQKAGDQVLDAL